MSSRLDRYVAIGHREVEGWLQPAAIRALLVLAQVQRELDIAGPVCEIGVHEGRSFILLHLLTVPPERSVAIDLFERQHENADHSGAGDRNRLLRNLRIHGCDLDRIELITENSLHLSAARIVEACGGPSRMFSIDGGHTAEITYNDLTLAAGAVRDGGLVILDDFFNEAWPGVAEGACRFMAQRGGLLPVAIGGNKFLFTTSPGFAAKYRERLEAVSGLAASSAIAFGHPVVVFRIPTLRDGAVRTHVWRAIRHTRIAHVLRKLAG